jgi:FkbM family methyltransferase
VKNLFERLLIKILKLLHTDLLGHAHVQIGVGHNTYSSGEEYVINSLLKEALKKEPLVIFDVGANIGDYAKMLRSRFSDAEIYCFEPRTETFNRLVSNTKGLNIHFNNVAVGSSNGILELFKGSNDTDATMVTAYKDTLSDVFTFAGEPTESMTCEMISLDDFCKNNNVSEIDFLKIDVEGHELEVLKGASKMIIENKINVIQFEFNEFNVFSRSFFYDYYKILPQYKFYRIMPKNELYPMGKYKSSLEIFRYQNILAVNNSLSFVYRP